MKLEVKPTPDGKWGLFVNGTLIGDSKARYDADFAKRVLERELEVGSKGVED